MRVRLALAILTGVAAAAVPAAADRFGGFSGVDRPYLVNQDRVCEPLAIRGGVASGAPVCTTAAADVVARLSIKDGVVQRGPKATFAATASGRTLTVTRVQTGTMLATWDAPDPIGKVLDVLAGPYEDRVAVVYRTRRLGKDVDEVIAFDVGRAAAPSTPTVPAPPTATAPPPPAASKELTAAVAAAHKVPAGARPRAIAAWQKVLALDPDHPEAHYRIAAAEAASKRTGPALAGLTTLAAARRDDAIEWLVEARFDPAFTAVRGDPAFRAAVGLDRKPTAAYERLMGFGGQWEQTGTACDKPEIRFTAKRDRTFQLRVKTVCQGSVFDTPFRGTWRLDGDRLVLALPNRGKVTSADEAGCVLEPTGDEDALRCTIGRDLEFSVLPARR